MHMLMARLGGSGDGLCQEAATEVTFSASNEILRYPACVIDRLDKGTAGSMQNSGSHSLASVIISVGL
jgi:hypothetical protein